MTIKAHYDGKVFVPDEPVPLTTGAAVSVTPAMQSGAARGADEALPRLPLINLPPGLAQAIAEDPELDISES